MKLSIYIDDSERKGSAYIVGVENRQFHQLWCAIGIQVLFDIIIKMATSQFVNIFFLFRFSFTNSCNKTYQYFSVGHRANFWTNRLFVAKKHWFYDVSFVVQERVCQKRLFYFHGLYTNRISLKSVFFCDQILVFKVILYY